MYLSLGSRIQEHCLLCSSKNEIFVSHPYADGYTCAYCRQNLWLSEENMRSYIIMKGGISEEQANIELRCGLPILLEGTLVYD